MVAFCVELICQVYVNKHKVKINFIFIFHFSKNEILFYNQIRRKKRQIFQNLMFIYLNVVLSFEFHLLDVRSLDFVLYLYHLIL